MNSVVRVNPLQTDNGFTLIEALIALAIFSIGILAVTSLLVSANLQSKNSSEITEASAIAFNHMEELILIPFDHNDLSPALNPHNLVSGKYRVQWNAIESDLNNDTINDSKTIEMTVSWNKLNLAGTNQRRVRLFFIKHNQ
jgi:prepilin-type N-terminal cleavage/methylation domain-containing protein